MKTLGWQDAAWAIAIGIAALAAFFIFRTPEPARTGLALVEVVCERSAARAAALERHVADPLALSGAAIEDGGDEVSLSHAELEQRLAELSAFVPDCAFSLEDWSIRPAGAGAAWLEGTLVQSDSQPSDLHGRRRPVRALFRERAGEPQLERVLLGPFERRLPEARP